MPAHKWEIDQAVEEGVIIHPSWGPLRIDAPTGSVRGIEFKRCTAVFDEQGRFNPRFDEDTTIYHEADTIIIAIGQAMDTAFLNELGTLEVFRDRRIKADPVTGETTVKGFFAGGDVATGPKMAIDAIAQGQEAAESIIRYLEGMDLKEGRRASETKHVEDAPPLCQKRPEWQFKPYRCPREQASRRSSRPLPRRRRRGGGTMPELPEMPWM